MNEEEKDYSLAIEKLQGLLSSPDIFLYAYVAGDKEQLYKMFYRISATDQKAKFKVKDNGPVDIEWAEDSLAVNLWGDAIGSSLELENSAYNCTWTLNSIATILTLLGIEVYVNNECYVPLEPSSPFSND